MSDLSPPAGWAWYLVRPNGAYLGSLVAARTRKLSWLLDGAATATFTMPGSHPNTALIAELATDVVCVRNGRTVFRGRVQASADTYSADTDSVNFTAVDYRGLLDRRLFWSTSTLSFRRADQVTIAWQMIADTQALPGGNLGVTRGAAPATGVLRDRDYQAGKPVGEAIAQLGQCQGGFEWEIDGSLAFNLYYPQRGRQTGLVLAWGRDITAINQQLNPSGYANAIWYSGSGQTTPVEINVGAFPVDIGRWDAQKSDPNLVLQQSLTDRAGYELTLASDFEPAFAVTMAEGGWDPGQLWLGDQAQIVAQAGRLNLNTTRRIIGINCDIGDDGGETVALTLGDATATLTGRLQSYQSRIAALERGLGYIPDVPVGAMFDWTGTTPPALFHWADGTGLAVAAYPELFAVIGYSYGGSGAMFALPDCRGRMTVAAGAGAGLTARTAGQSGGTESVSLQPQQNGQHTHGGIVQSGDDTPDHAHIGTTGLQSSDHSHNFATGNNNVDHTHTLGWNWINSNAGPGSTGYYVIATQSNWPSGGASQPHAHGGTTGGVSGDHGHNFTSAGSNARHHHQVNVATDSGGSTGQGHENMPPWIAIGKVIKLVSAQAAGSLIGREPTND